MESTGRTKRAEHVTGACTPAAAQADLTAHAASATQPAVIAPASTSTLSPGEARSVLVAAWACRCARCGYEWLSVSRDLGVDPPVPTACPGCRARGWQRPAGPRGLASLSPRRRKAISRQGVAARKG